MPQVDLENIVSACAGGCTDNRIACETQAECKTDDEPTGNDVITDDSGVVHVDPDFPPESFWLSKDAEYDWFDRNAFYERRDSSKGNSTNLNPSVNPNSNSNSQRFSVNLKSKASIIGLPKTQKATYVDSKRRTSKPSNIGLFPKRPEPVGKSTVPVAEPGSPKVSCMGRVRSKRGRRRSNSLNRKEKTVEKSRSGGEKKNGLYSRILSMFRTKKGQKKSSRLGSRRVVEVVEEKEPVVVERRRESVSWEVREILVGGETTAEPPGLGGVKRFSSGRRSGSWTVEDFSQTISGPLDSDWHVGRS